MSILRKFRLPSPSMVVAVAALLVALGGTSYAAATLAANSVGAKQLKKNAVERVKIKNNAVDASKVLDGALTGNDIKESTLAKVRAAAVADSATHANSTAALDNVTYKTATTSGAPGTTSAATASCDPGQHAIGGGVKVDNPQVQLVDDSYPDVAGTAWTAHVDNVIPSPGLLGFTVVAICTTTTSTG